MKGVLAAVLLALAVFSFWQVREFRSLQSKLPPTEWTTREKLNTKGKVPIAGTGSMQPLIPSGLGIVAYADVVPFKFETLKAGECVIFEDLDGGWIIHQLIELDSAGWITSGSHNKHYDNGRVTPENYIGTVVKLHILTP